MFAVIFEVTPKPERFNEYLAYAKQLKPELERIEGFIENNRFASKRRAGLLLSLSLWRDEKAVIRWRTAALHHKVQEKGRFEVFQDYHLRVGEIAADSALPTGQALAGQRFDETEAGTAKLIGIHDTDLPGLAPDAGAGDLAAAFGPPLERADGLVEWDVFENINQPGHALLLTSWRQATAADAWETAGQGGNGKARRRRVRVIRDYGLADRREAPQYYPPVPRPLAG